MTYQRAVVNCRRCYALACQETKANVIRQDGELERNLVDKDSLWQARNEAMKALEQEMISHSFFGTPQQSIQEIHKALTACMNCTYKKPEIAELFDSSDGSV